MLEEDTYNDDDYFDRTLEMKKVKKEESETFTLSTEKTQITYNFQSLKQRLEELIIKQNDLNIKILDFQPEKKPESEKEEELDELEKYMQVNQINLDIQQKKKLLIELAEINAEIEELINFF